MHKQTTLQAAKAYVRSLQNYDWQNAPLHNAHIHNFQETVVHCFNSSMPTQEQGRPEHVDISLEKVQQLLLAHENESISMSIDIVCIANAKLDQEGVQMARICQEQGQAFVCVQGCTGCCHHLVMCEEAEALRIAGYLHAHTQIKDAFLHRYALWDAQTKSFRASYMAWAKELYTHGHDNGTHSLHEYAHPCPFLNAQNLCSIYAVRPYGCRSTVSVNALCAQAQGEFSGKHTIQYSLFTGHHLMRKALMHMCQKGIFSTEPLSLPEIIYELLCEKE